MASKYQQTGRSSKICEQHSMSTNYDILLKETIHMGLWWKSLLFDRQEAVLTATLFMAEIAVVDH